MHVQLRFYEELNDFLPNHRKKKSFIFEFINKQRIRDVLETLRVPKTEVDLILVNGNSVNFDYLLNNGDRISIYPKFEALDIRSLTKLRNQPLRETKFILDVHLGKLTKYLRMLGFDCFYNETLEDAEIAKLSQKQQRIVLTRDKGLLQDKRVDHGYWVRNIKLEKQLTEILSRFDLYDSFLPFTRCLECNTALEALDKNKIIGKVPKKTQDYYQKFFLCKHCNKIFWQGSHYQNMLNFIEKLKIQKSA